MVDAVRDIQVPKARSHGAIVRPLPIEELGRNVGAGRDAGSVLAGIVAPQDPGWFDTFWYREQPAPRASIGGKAMRRLWRALAVGRRSAHDPGHSAETGGLGHELALHKGCDATQPGSSALGFTSGASVRAPNAPAQYAGPASAQARW